jgi:hypothetical protein
MQLLINGTDKINYLKRPSMRITKSTDNRSSMGFSLITTPSAYSDNGIIIGQDVKFLDDDDNIIFGGVIKQVRVIKLDPLLGTDKKIELSIIAYDYNEITARRTSSGSYTNKTAGFIVNSLRTNVLNLTGYSDGVGYGFIDDGATLDTYQTFAKTVKDVLDDLALVSGYKWYIDEDRDLYFIDENTIDDAPHDLVETAPTFTDFQVIDVSITLDNYRNKQFVKGADSLLVSAEIASEITERSNIEGSSGVYGDTIDSTEFTSEADALYAAEDALKRYGTIPYAIRFTTMTNVFKPSTKLKCNLPSVFIGSDMYFLIEMVDIVDLGTAFMSTVTATRRSNTDFSTKRTEGYKEYFANLLKNTVTQSGFELANINFIDHDITSADLLGKNTLHVKYDPSTILIDAPNSWLYSFVDIQGVEIAKPFVQNVTDFTLTVVSDSQINASWTNP